jgi:nitrite reductase (NADH) small subunit
VELNSMTDGVPEAPSENRPENSPEFVTVARVGEIPAGEGRSYEVGQRIVAVFNQGDTYTAIDDICPHAGASLSGGYVENGAVMCPWHAWKFCTREGTWLDNPKSSIRQDCFDVRVVGDEIQVRPAS